MSNTLFSDALFEHLQTLELSSKVTGKWKSRVVCVHIRK